MQWIGKRVQEPAKRIMGKDLRGRFLLNRSWETWSDLKVEGGKNPDVIRTGRRVKSLESGLLRSIEARIHPAEGKLFILRNEFELEQHPDLSGWPKEHQE